VLDLLLDWAINMLEQTAGKQANSVNISLEQLSPLGQRACLNERTQAATMLGTLQLLPQALSRSESALHGNIHCCLDKDLQ
jgi:hypothetical protein